MLWIKPPLHKRITEVMRANPTVPGARLLDRRTVAAQLVLTKAGMMAVSSLCHADAEPTNPGQA
jgi:hypothetical protein